MTGVLVNTAAVIVGSCVGLLAKKLIPAHWSDFIMKGLALCTIYIGIDGALSGENTLVTILSMTLGAVAGIAADLDRHLNNMAKRLEDRFKNPGEEGSIAEGFITASLLFCVGALTIVGALQAGLTGNNDMLFTKATLDFVSAVIFSASLGIGVMLAACFVLVFEGAIVLLAQGIEPFLSDYVIGEMTCVGSILIIALGLNMLGVTKLKIMNYLPGFRWRFFLGIFIK